MYSAREMMFGSRETFDYFECSSCGCLQIAEIPADLSRHYPSNYYSHSTHDDIRRPGPLRRWLERQRTFTAFFGRRYRLSRLIKPFVALPHEIHLLTGVVVLRAGLKDFDAAILDVGSGSSAVWLRRMELLGFRNLTGVDPFADRDVKLGAVRVLRKELAAVEGQYDLIRLSHSLEHMPDQHRTVADLRRLLAPGGTVVIRIPIVPSAVWERYGVNWAQLDAPRHLYLHTPHSIETLASAAGLRLTGTVYDSSAFSWWASEQYARDIPLVDPKSHWQGPGTVFTEAELHEYERLAEQANREGRADQATFYFKAG